jgi:hypothetical protein
MSGLAGKAIRQVPPFWIIAVRAEIFALPPRVVSLSGGEDFDAIPSIIAELVGLASL